MIHDEPRQQMSKDLQTALLHAACAKMRKADTRNEREKVLAEMIDLIRTPTSTFFAEESWRVL